MFVLLVSANVYNTAFAQTEIGNQQVIQLNYSSVQNCKALVYLPDDYNSTSASYPLIITLHGTGQAGTDINQMITDGLPQKIAQGLKPQAVNPKDGKTYKFIVFSPQAPSWSFQEQHVAYMLPIIQKMYRIDPSRIYITGYSAGGYGTLTCITDDVNFTAKIAAMSPMADAAIEPNRIAGLKNAATTNLPVWSICGTADSFWPAAQSYVNDINSYNPGIKAAITGLPNVGHWSWQSGYDPNWRPNGLNVYEWFLQFTRGASAPPPPVSNQAPVAKVAASSIAVQLPTSTASLDGSGSSDPDGSIASYAWSQVSGPNTAKFSTATASKTNVTGLAAGTYVFQLKVTDNKGATATANVTVTVTAAPNQAPVAKISSSLINITLPVSSTTLDGSGSSDPDGSIAAYTWSQVSGPGNAIIASPAAAKTTVSSLVTGTYVFQLTVKDNKGATASAQTKVIVIAASNKAPVAKVATGNIAITLPTSTATLDGSGSSDADGRITSYSWKQTSGPSVSTIGSAASAKTGVSGLTTAGTYVFQLTVKDNNGATATASVNVVVTAAANKPPVAKVATAGITLTLPQTTTTLDGSGSSDPDGSIAAYSWLQSSGPSVSTIGNAASSKTGVSGLSKAGTYVFQLTVKDNKGATATAKVTVTVKAAVTIPQVVAAVANANITVKLPVTSVTLDGSASTGTIKSYVWTQMSGPSQSSLGNKTAATTTVSSLVVGTYVYQLTVTGDNGITSSANATVVVDGSAAGGGTACKGKRIYLKQGSDKGIYVNGPTFAYLPGDTLVLKGSPWSYVSFNDVYGTASCPVTIINEGGPVTLTSGFAFNNCRYIKVTGTGTADKYGFHIEHPTGDGVAIDIFGRSSNVEVSNIDIYHKTYGFWVKQEQECADSLQNGKWTLDHITIHDNRIRRMGQEGMYMGSTDPNGKRGVVCNGVTIYPKPIYLSNIKVYNNIVDSTNRSGIQLSCAKTGDNEIYNNQVSNSGFEYATNQGNGISLGGYSQAYIHDNTVKNSYALGILVLGAGNIKIDNNTISGSGQLGGKTVYGMDGIMVDTRNTDPVDSSWLTITNNKISNYTGEGIRFYKTFDTYRKGNIICNNTGSVNIAAGIDWTTNCAGKPPVNAAPIAKAGNDVTITLPANSVTLDGTGSADADGVIKTYAWAKVSGPAQFTLGTPAASKSTFTNLVAGKYGIALTVTDDKGLTGKDTVWVTVNPAANGKPVANAGADVTITLPTNSVTLDGSKSSETGGTIKSYSWSKVSGPTQFALGTTTASKTTFSNLVAGKYGVALTVTDDKGVTAKDTVWVTVNAAAPGKPGKPMPNAGADVTITLPANSVSLDGSKSYETGGTISQYIWTKVIGPSSYKFGNSLAAQTTISGLVEGTYGIELKVKDGIGVLASDTMYITVKSANAGKPPVTTPPTTTPPETTPPVTTPPAGTGGPVARAGDDINLQLPLNATTVYGNTSTDAYGTITSYKWRKVSGPATGTWDDSKGYKLLLTNLTEGTYVVELTVTDNNNKSDKDTMKVIVAGANKTPVANAGKDQTINLPTTSVTLDGTGSYDPDGTVAKYYWSKITGPSSYNIASVTGSKTTVTGLVEGEYIFQLNIQDNLGASSWAVVKVTVQKAINLLPLAVINKADTAIVAPQSAVTLDASKSYDVDGTITKYQWKQESGPAQTTIANAAGSVTQATKLTTAGNYVFSVVVTDNNGATNSAKVTIRVSKAIVQQASADAAIDVTAGAYLYPNPATGSTINVAMTKGGTGKLSIMLMDGNGRILSVKSTDASQPLQQLDISQLLPGSYYVVLLSDSGVRKSLPFIRMKD
ncbi:PKD domain-containing protein [Deminuibacter soli]|uniref:PKD domain-containing protein n=1 Tax=Deminuibacter soli TaxID=2291815 RepID=UPI0013149D95|nr:PKD domain-containing protein [Deminuibacter soli]